MYYKLFKSIFPISIGFSITIILIVFGILIIKNANLKVNNEYGILLICLSVFGVAFLTGFYLGYGIILLFEYLFEYFQEARANMHLRKMHTLT